MGTAVIATMVMGMEMGMEMEMANTSCMRLTCEHTNVHCKSIGC